MSKHVNRTLTCPACLLQWSADVRADAPRSGWDSDFGPRFADGVALAQGVHTCPGCRYSAPPEGFLGDDAHPASADGPRWTERWQPLKPVRVLPPDPEEVPVLRRWLRRGEALGGLELDGGEPYGGERWLIAARCHEFLHDSDPLGVADLCLRGAWCARAEDRRPLERRCLEAAIEHLDTAVAMDLVDEDEQVRIAYLVAELCRRVGDYPRAVDLFDEVLTGADPDDDEGAFYLAMAGRQQSLAMVQSDVDTTLDPAVGPPGE